MGFCENEDITTENVEQVADASAQFITASCSFYRVNLSAGVKQMHPNIKMIDVAETTLQAI